MFTVISYCLLVYFTTNNWPWFVLILPVILDLVIIDYIEFRIKRL